MASNKLKSIASIILHAACVLFFSFTAISCKPEYSMRLLEDGRIYFNRGTIEGVIANYQNMITDSDFKAVKKKLDSVESIVEDFIFGSLQDNLWRDYESVLRAEKSTTESEIEYNRYARGFIRGHYGQYKRQYVGLVISESIGEDRVSITFLPAMKNWMNVKEAMIFDGGPSFWTIDINLTEKKIEWFTVHGEG